MVPIPESKFPTNWKCCKCAEFLSNHIVFIHPSAAGPSNIREGETECIGCHHKICGHCHPGIDRPINKGTIFAANFYNYMDAPSPFQGSAPGKKVGDKMGVWGEDAFGRSAHGKLYRLWHGLSPAQRGTLEKKVREAQALRTERWYEGRENMEKAKEGARKFREKWQARKRKDAEEAEEARKFRLARVARSMESSGSRTGKRKRNGSE